MAYASFLDTPMSHVLRGLSSSIRADGHQFTISYIQGGSQTDISGDLRPVDEVEIPDVAETRIAYQLTPQQVAELLDLEKGHFRYASE